MIARTLSLARKGGKLVSLAVTEKRPCIAYVGGWLGKFNLGDEALWYAYEKLFPSHKLVHFDGGKLSGAVCRLPRLAGGLLGGGTLIAQKRDWLTLATQFAASGQPLFIFGTGVEEPSFWPGDTTVQDWLPLLAKCRFIGVRGPISAQMLAAAGVKNVEVVGDPVIAYALDEVSREVETNSIGLNIGTSDGRIWGDEKRVASEVASLARRAKSAGWNVHWYVVWPKDLEMTQQVAKESGTSAHIHTIYTDADEYMRSVRRLGAFVGMKLHATVLATCALTPSLMLEYRPKCRDYMQSVEQDEFTFRTESFTADQLWSILSAWQNNRAAAVNVLAARMQRAKRLQQDFARQVFPAPAAHRS
jgi:polysaccharide pyruvyl transferase WcaK-like protein